MNMMGTKNAKERKDIVRFVGLKDFPKRLHGLTPGAAKRKKIIKAKDQADSSQIRENVIRP